MWTTKNGIGTDSLSINPAKKRVASFPSKSQNAESFDLEFNLLSRLDWEIKNEDQLVRQMLIEFNNTVDDQKS